MADNPAHYHAIQKVTQRWADYLESVRRLAHATPDELARHAEVQRDREVHVTGRPHSEKGTQRNATESH